MKMRARSFFLQAIDAHDLLPFELCAMEALLHTTVMYFERRISLLSWMLEIVLNELQAQTMWVTSSDEQGNV